MTFKKALNDAAEKAGWSSAKIAGEIGVSQYSVDRWLAGKGQPNFTAGQALRIKLPGFADMLDRGPKMSA